MRPLAEFFSRNLYVRWDWYNIFKMMKSIAINNPLPGKVIIQNCKDKEFPRQAKDKRNASPLNHPYKKYFFKFYF